jgi:predicted helicase
MDFTAYVHDVAKRLASGIAREHAYRPSLQNLLEATIPDILATNDPARIECGAPDFILTRRKIDVGYIEAKDIGVDLDKTENDEQLKRYRESLDNLILTDYLEFRFFRHGEKVETIRIAEIQGKTVKALPDQFEKLKALLIDFAAFEGQTIKSAKNLAEMMAHKARLMKDVFAKALKTKNGNTSLHEQLWAFRRVLVHDLTEDQFADVYAQTIAYGLFTARLHDKTLEDFSRGEAFDLIPKSNPFLRQLFHYVAGADLDHRVAWIIDALCEVYRATDLRAILKDFGATTGQTDPILHFYETFLAAYDPALRKSRGVWYTPEPVVQFIVRAVDDVLKDHFGLPEGLAHTGTVNIDLESGFDNKGKRTYIKKPVHRVQLLDVATGTGTFLAEAVKHLYRGFKGQEGLWNNYVEKNLLPRLHGFELLMASYAMCHMKLDLLLQQTNYKPSDPHKPPRVSVYLTNALEEYHAETDMLPYTDWLTREGNEASYIKKNMPIMIAFGNPPYSGHSANKGAWMETLLESYKTEPSGGKLQERNGKWLNDDYVKFIRLGQHYIWKNGEGVLAYITNHSYLDNPTFRGMRWQLMCAFDEIYILDLHGNAKKKEVTPDGKPDKNVFDIQQGVAIIVAVKRSSLSLQGEGRGEGARQAAKPPAILHHADLWGSRDSKYDFLSKETLKSVNWTVLTPTKPECFFVPKNNDLQGEYKKFFAVNEMFPVNSVGIVTARDALTIHEKKEDLIATIERFSNLSVEDARYEFDLGKDAQDWSVADAQADLKATKRNPKNIHPIAYRPFDTRWTYYTGNSKGFHCRPRGEVMRHFLAGENVGLITARSNKSGRPDHFFISKNMSEAKAGESSTQSCIMPLYLYQSTIGKAQAPTPNLDPKLYAKIKKAVPDVTPETLFDYIYAVLHSPAYRARYAEFLKSDFPRIPYPSGKKIFHALAEHGAALRGLHLMDSPVLDHLITTYPVGGTHDVKALRYENGNVFINETQYFGGVPETAWNFYIGGYQPAQKWLKDRKGRSLSVEDIRHYQRIITALTETAKIMADIETIDFLPNDES